MIATSQAAALVKGAAATARKAVKVTVTRAFCVHGKRLEVGAALEVAESVARQLMSDGKAVAFIEKAIAKKADTPEQKPDAKTPEDKKPSMKGA